MSQHDFVINNQGFPAFRADLNDFLSAVKTTHSGSSLPSGAAAGTIWLDTSSATVPLLKYYDGADNILLATINHTTNTVTFSGVATDLVNDLTPQLGGNLDTNTHSIVTTSNANVKLYPNGSGVVEIGGGTNSGRIQLNCESNSHGIKLASPPHSAAQSYTLTFPSTAPSAGKVLQTDGSGNLSFATVGGDGTVDWDTTVKTSGFTATANKGYFCNTTSAAFTVTLPSSPSAGDEIVIVDYAGTFATNNITLGRNGNKIESGTTDKKLTTNREATRIVYIDNTQGWISYSGANEGSQNIDPLTYSIDFLVIAGGGGGGSDAVSSTPGAGGGGAGGYRTSTQTVNAGTVITVTVGDGGNGGVAGSSGTKTSGSNSSISGSGLTTITSTGGGHGAAYNGYAAATGGSGGGGSYTGGSNGHAGAAGNTPSTSPSQGNSGGDSEITNQAGGGGGGAGGAGGVPSASTAGAGGAGTASSITGSSVTRAGGGGGGGGHSSVDNGGTASGGGGAGGGKNTQEDGVAGTANLGGGGGGGAAFGSGGKLNGDGGNGGKGVVILSVPTASYSGTTTGSPTVTTSGSNTILQFNGSGSYTT